MKSKRTRHHDKWKLPPWQTNNMVQRMSPPQLFVGSFALLIVFGTLGFRFHACKGFKLVRFLDLR
jgi:hypothetical protein